MTATTPIEEIELALRGELNARAVGLKTSRPPVPRIMAAARRHRTRRRSYAGTGFVLVAALIAAAAPAVLGAAHGLGAASAAAGSAPSPSQLEAAASDAGLSGDVKTCTFVGEFTNNNDFVRPAKPLIQGQGRLPTTAAAFNGTPESTTIGAALFEHW